MRPAAALVAALFAFVSPIAVFAQAPVQPVEVRSSVIERFRYGSGETRFGALEYLGGFEMPSSEDEFGQLSSFRFLTPGGDFIGVADHGYWFFGSIERDARQRPIGVRDFRMQAMVDEQGRAIADKAEKDAEGLDVHDGVATVAFERKARVSEFVLGPSGVGAPRRHLDFLVPRGELRFNAGFETLARAPDDSHLRGARIVVAERSIDTQGNIFAAILEGPERGVFKVRRTDGYDVTDGAFLPDGDLLLLERRFSPPFGVGMRLRRVPGETVSAGALVDGETLMEASLANAIDNMEGLDVWRRDDGALIVSLISDDNQAFLQRSIYLEFLLVE